LAKLLAFLSFLEEQLVELLGFSFLTPLEF
jgi:hypothetical protein